MTDLDFSNYKNFSKGGKGCQKRKGNIFIASKICL
jgi:hypothetical protein